MLFFRSNALNSDPFPVLSQAHFEANSGDFPQLTQNFGKFKQNYRKSGLDLALSVNVVDCETVKRKKIDSVSIHVCFNIRPLPLTPMTAMPAVPSWCPAVLPQTDPCSFPRESLEPKAWTAAPPFRHSGWSQSEPSSRPHPRDPADNSICLGRDI